MTVRDLIDSLLDADTRGDVVITVPRSDGTAETTEVDDVHIYKWGVEIVTGMVDGVANPCANCQEFSCDGCQWNGLRRCE